MILAYMVWEEMILLVSITSQSIQSATTVAMAPMKPVFIIPKEAVFTVEADTTNNMQP